MRITKIDSTQFQRKPDAHEMRVYTNSLRKGLDLLDKRMDIIIHNASFPAIRTENTGIGSMLSRTTIEKLFPFIKKHGFKGIQVDPIGLRDNGNYSPYSPQSTAKNIFMIPLEKLASYEYRFLYPPKTFNALAENSHDDTHINFNVISSKYNRILKAIYLNFQKGTFLKNEFARFKEAKGKQLEQAAIFNVLDNVYKRDWTTWNGMDKNLYAPKTPKQAEVAKARIEEIKKEYADEIDFFMFNQMLVEREMKKLNSNLKRANLSIIGDSPIALSRAEEWVYQDLFLKDMALGCPPDEMAKDGQRWGFKFFNPKEIFNPDGTLGRAGEILKKKYEEYFENFPGGLRIDHIIGLIDPFVYNVKEPMTNANSGRIYSQEGPFQKHGKEFQNILTKIVLPAAKKYGVDTSSIICEDLGTVTEPTREAMKDLNLSGIAITQYDYRGAETPAKNVIMTSSHDNISFLEYVENFFKDKGSQHFLHKTGVLGHDVSPKDFTEEQRLKYIDEIRNDKKKFIAASFAELFTSPAKRIQMFFTDFWGIPETYNRPGTTEGNWELRVGSNFEHDYYKAVSEGKAPNLAQAVLMALRQRGLDKGNETLVEKLEESAKILAE